MNLRNLITMRLFKNTYKTRIGHQRQYLSQDALRACSAGKEPIYFEFVREWPIKEKQSIINDMIVIENFLSESDETKLLEEIEPYMKRLRYEFDHWDDAIHGYRETERQRWYPHNKLILSKINKIAFQEEIMPYIHILDLAADGVIKPHVDSSRYCGSTIAGLSLLSDSVMRLVRTDEKKYEQSLDNSTEYRSQVKSSPTSTETSANFFVNVLLKQRSLYIMRDTARYNFTHEILKNDASIFKGDRIEKDRRISVICRNKP